MLKTAIVLDVEGTVAPISFGTEARFLTAIVLHVEGTEARLQSAVICDLSA